MNILVAEREPVVSEMNRRYILTDGLDVYEMRRMDLLSFELAQERAMTTVQNLWWEDGGD